MTASLFIAYFLWFFFGWTGLHLFYVGRDEQMFVYLTTCGGFFFGWFRDLWRLPTYCGQADETTEPLNAELTIHQIRAQTSPQGPHWFQLTRFLASACVGSQGLSRVHPYSVANFLLSACMAVEPPCRLRILSGVFRNGL